MKVMAEQPDLPPQNVRRSPADVWAPALRRVASRRHGWSPVFADQQSPPPAPPWRQNWPAVWETALRYYGNRGSVYTASPVVALQGVSVTSSAASGTLSVTAAPPVADEPPTTLTVVTAEDPAELQGQEVDYGPLVTLVGLTSGSGCLVLAFVTAAQAAAVMLVCEFLRPPETLGPPDLGRRSRRAYSDQTRGAQTNYRSLRSPSFSPAARGQLGRCS
jgi:hypothetical protein